MLGYPIKKHALTIDQIVKAKRHRIWASIYVKPYKYGEASLK